MVMIGGKDRTDYRAMDMKLLIEESIFNPNSELCIVLGERLSLIDHKLVLVKRERDDLRNVLGMAQGAAVVMRAELETYRSERNG